MISGLCLHFLAWQFPVLARFAWGSIYSPGGGMYKGGGCQLIARLCFLFKREKVKAY
jgi:hypothetical protein